MPVDAITTIQHRIIHDPFLEVVLYCPEIPANTGNIARLCGATEVKLHLIHPLGFKVDDRHLKRAGLDYWTEVDISHHENFACFVACMRPGSTLIAFSRHAQALYTEARVRKGDCLLFGQETQGLPNHIMEAYPSYRVPIWGKVRSLNLATAAGIVTYHFLHQLQRF